jgi:ribosomal protein S18 acetylase RimI-like enzyme
MTVRPVTRHDMTALKGIIDATEMFPSEMLDDMAAAFLDGDASEEFWLTFDDGSPKAVAYFVAERLTEGTWNLLLIAVNPDQQGQGIGAKLLHHVEQALAARNERILLVETSGLPEFERTRRFYLKNGYELEATIRDFYQDGENKLVFRKVLTAA